MADTLAMLTEVELLALESWQIRMVPTDADSVWLWVIAMVLAQHGPVTAAGAADLVGFVVPRERGC